MHWEQAAWCGEAATTLAPALGNDSAQIRAEVDQGAATLWRIPEHGYMITRLESFEDRRELVLVAWAGKNTGPLVEHVQTICKRQGIHSVRFHSSIDPKLVQRFVKKWGFAPVETVYRWVADGR